LKYHIREICILPKGYIIVVYFLLAAFLFNGGISRFEVPRQLKKKKTTIKKKEEKKGCPFVREFLTFACGDSRERMQSDCPKHNGGREAFKLLPFKIAR
jgi:hypothetical protein